MHLQHQVTGWGTGTVASLGRRISRETARQFQELFKTNHGWCVDTANSYGSGDAERLLAQVLPEPTVSHTLITKAGYIYSDLSSFWGPSNQFIKKLKQKVFGKQCFVPSYLERCLNHSLARLRKPSVSVFLLHDPPLSAVNDQAVWHKLKTLRGQGLIKHIGLSSSKPEVIAAAMAVEQIEVLQTPANLLVAPMFKSIWLKCYQQGVQLVGNHLFPPTLVNRAGMSHSVLAQATAKLLPPGSILLCGTHKPAHLQEFSQWINNPCSREQLAQYFKHAQLPDIAFHYD